MAIIKCQECGGQVSTSAKACPTCGAKPNLPKLPFWKVLLLALLAIWGIGKLMESGSDTLQNSAFPTQSVQTPKTSDVSTIDNSPLPYQTTATDDSSWNYKTYNDDISGKEAKTAIIMSNNTYQLDFPYNGGTRGTITLRRHPRYGKDVIFSVNKGQLLCNVVDGCRVTIRFDDKKPYSISAVEPDDHSSDTLFLHGYDKLLKDFKQSQKVVIEVTFFRQGNRTFEFDTSGLKWN